MGTVNHLHMGYLIRSVYTLAAVGLMVTRNAHRGENHMPLLQQETGQRKCLIDLHELTKEQMEVVSLKRASS